MRGADVDPGGGLDLLAEQEDSSGFVVGAVFLRVECSQSIWLLERGKDTGEHKSCPYGCRCVVTLMIEDGG